MTLWQTTPRGRDPPREVYVIVETPRGSRNKYELAKHFPGVLLDRVLPSSLTYPADYGLVPRSWGTDNDPLDALVVGTAPTFPGCIVRARPIGLLDMLDQGARDEKVLCALVGDTRFADARSTSDIGQALLAEIEDFFRNYKRLEKEAAAVDVKGWKDEAVAADVLEAAFARYHEKYETQ